MAKPDKRETENDGGLGPLTPVQRAAVERLTRVLADPRPLSTGEVAGLGMEALEGYAYGERIRYDTQGRRWTFRRQAEDDQWCMVASVEFFGIPFGDGAVPLDRVAGKQGEEQLLALVETLAQAAFYRQRQAVELQKSMQTEADTAETPLIEPADAGS